MAFLLNPCYAPKRHTVRAASSSNRQLRSHTNIDNLSSFQNLRSSPFWGFAANSLLNPSLRQPTQITPSLFESQCSQKKTLCRSKRIYHSTPPKRAQDSRGHLYYWPDDDPEPALIDHSGFMNFLDHPDSGIRWTRKEIAVHDTISDCWLVIRNKVYNVTEWIPDHPGQLKIMTNAGKDSTNLFQHTGHSLYAHSVLRKFYIGEVVDPTPRRATLE